MIYLVSGVPGAGKSYYLARVALQAKKSGAEVFTSHPVQGCYQLRREYLTERIFPAGATLVVDEANVWFNSRRWADIDGDTLTYFAQHRHNMTDIWIGTQHPARVDVTLRENANEFLWLRSFGVPMFPKVDEDKGSRRVMVKRAIIMCIDHVPDYDAWGVSRAKRQEIEGYRRSWHLVRPSVFKRFDSWDDSQLAHRDRVPELEWEWYQDQLLWGGRAIWNYPE